MNEMDGRQRATWKDEHIDGTSHPPTLLICSCLLGVIVIIFNIIMHTFINENMYGKMGYKKDSID